MRTANDFTMLLVNSEVITIEKAPLVELIMLRYMETFRRSWAEDTKAIKDKAFIDGLERSKAIGGLSPKETSVFYVSLSKEEIDLIIKLLSACEIPPMAKKLADHFKALTL